MPKVGGGRVAALEIMTSTAAVKNLIREGKTFQLPSIIETNTNLGMQTLGQCLQKLLAEGKITPETAVMKGLDPALAGAVRPAKATKASVMPPPPDGQPQTDHRHVGPALGRRRSELFLASLNPPLSRCGRSRAEFSVSYLRVRLWRPDGDRDTGWGGGECVDLLHVRAVVRGGRYRRLDDPGDHVFGDGQRHVAMPIVDAADQVTLLSASVVPSSAPMPCRCG